MPIPSHRSSVIGRATGLGVLVFASVVACDREQAPAEIRLDFPPVIASRDPVLVSVQALDAQGAKRSVSIGADYRVEPADLAAVSKAGLLSCARSGDGKLTVSIAGVSRDVVVRCRIVDHIDAPNAGRVEIAAGPFEPKVRVLDKSGRELSDVPVSYFSKNAGVVYAKDDRLVPKLVGTATLVARAGDRSAEFKVDVVRKVVVEALPIDQNRKLHFSLEPGKYELKVKLSAEHRVSFEWRGAPYCNTSSVGLEHTSVCGLRAESGGGVVFDNPGYLADGSKTPSLAGVELYEIP
jgi:hypothetical protein